MKTKAYSYLRFSTPEQMEGDSFRRQTALAYEYAQRHNLELDEELTFHDQGISAYRGKNSEVGRLADFLVAVRTGLVPSGSTLLMESLDRLSRQVPRKALRVLEEIIEEDITVVTFSDNKVYTKDSIDSDPMSLMMSLMVFIRANEESAMKSKRLKAAWVGKRDKQAKGGGILTAQVPGWLEVTPERKFKVVPERAKVVKRIFKESLSGKGHYTIAVGLERDKVPVFGRGKAWFASYVSKILRNPAVVGTFVPHTLEYIDGKKTRIPRAPISNYFPSIISESDFQKVRAAHLDSTHAHKGAGSPGRPIRNIFSGMLVCARCGGRASLVTKGGKKAGPEGSRYIACTNARYGRGCKYTAINYDIFEGLFIDQAPALLSLAPAGGSEDIDSRIEKLQTNLDSLSSALSGLTEGYSRTRAESLLVKIRDVEQEQAQLKHELVALEEKRDATSGPLVAHRVRELKAVLKGEPLERLKAHMGIRMVFSGVAVDFDKRIATLGWKHGGESEFTFGFPQE